ncbi:MAG TPA: glycosyltransferase family 39 protein, partial [Candidatus Limnocylindrales bacterium]
MRRALTDDRLVLGGLLLLAAAVRFPGLAARGTFDQDQGHDALTLLRLIQGGGLPLLGPPTSIGDFHHGAFYYYLLAPAAMISGGDPVVITAWIALLGVAAVGVTWWLAKAIAGPVAGPLAGFVAGLLLAVSPAAIDESTFIWNPNPIPLFASLALAAAWRAHQTGRARWWTLAIACAGMVVQLHVLGVVFLPPILALLVADWRAARRRGETDSARQLARGGWAGLGIVALLFVPLLLHELQFDWSETRNAIAYFTSGGSGQGQLALVPRLVFTLIRIIAWPLVRDVTSLVPVSIALAAVLTLGPLVTLRATGERRTALTWLVLTIVWSTVALTFLAPSLQTVVAGLPNDHYHAFLDPVIVTIIGVAIGLLATGVIPFARRQAFGRPALGVAAAAQ